MSFTELLPWLECKLGILRLERDESQLIPCNLDIFRVVGKPLKMSV